MNKEVVIISITILVILLLIIISIMYKIKIRKKFLKIFLIVLNSLLIIFLTLFLILFYGPDDSFRNFWIPSAMTTKSHNYLAKFFYTDKTINRILKNNRIIENDDITDTSLIKMDNDKTKYKNQYEKEILADRKNKLYKLINIKGDGYRGYLVAIYKPEKVKIATTRYLRTRGENILTISKNNNAVVAINGGGFYDPDWNSNGALPHGVVIKDGKVVSEYQEARMGGGFVGFTNENKLVLGKMSKEEALNMGMRDAVEFGPFLIVNGKKNEVLGNGGWGIAPRTVIGQREDGIVLFLVIDGRLATSLGADMNDLQDVMSNYGAYNAANMDGGSSSELVIDNKIINTPVAGGDYGLRDMPTFWIVTK